MGGTSTDVSRYAGSYEHVYESTTAGVTIQSAQVHISRTLFLTPSFTKLPIPFYHFTFHQFTNYPFTITNLKIVQNFF